MVPLATLREASPCPEDEALLQQIHWCSRCTGFVWIPYFWTFQHYLATIRGWLMYFVGLSPSWSSLQNWAWKSSKIHPRTNVLAVDYGGRETLGQM
jgi:hypothetical protein